MPSPPGLHAAVDNRLLATLPAEEYHRLLPQLEPVAFTLGHVIYEAGRRLVGPLLTHPAMRLALQLPE